MSNPQGRDFKHRLDRVGEKNYPSFLSLTNMDKNYLSMIDESEKKAGKMKDQRSKIFILSAIFLT